jgi:hypothetical protein
LRESFGEGACVAGNEEWDRHVACPWNAEHEAIVWTLFVMSARVHTVYICLQPGR